jgi:beta-lactam-binding protein with PASTA domain
MTPARMVRKYGWALVVAIALSGCTVQACLNACPPAISVPNVVGMQAGAATLRLSTIQGFRLFVVLRSASTSGRCCRVVGQSPLGGKGVTSGSIITLTVQGAPPSHPVPSAKDRKLASVLPSFRADGLSVFVHCVGYAGMPRRYDDMVSDQFPPAGRLAAPGSQVLLWIDVFPSGTAVRCDTWY